MLVDKVHTLVVILALAQVNVLLLEQVGFVNLGLLLLGYEGLVV